MPSKQMDGERASSTSENRPSNCSPRLRTKRGQFAVPGTISLSAANIWQPLHTPSVNVSARSKKPWNSSRVRGVIQDGLGPALARAEHVAVGKSAAGHEPAEIRELHATGEHVAHVHVVRLEAHALEHRGHLDLAVHALLAQHGDPWAAPCR